MRGYNVLLPMAFHYTGTPVLAMAKRLADGDQGLINDFVKVYKIPKEKLDEFTEPIAMAKYFHQEIKQGMKEIGYSIDWRREFTTVDPQYNRFIEWQFEKLRQGGYISQGSHPVGWCPRDGNPVGQHDTVGDVEPEIGEFTVIKFKQDHVFYPAATLRPETVFGVTNIWLNPDAEYVRAAVDGEEWIISKESVEKLANQNRKVKIQETMEGKRLIGKQVENPVTGKSVLILPADFVDPKNATGVVMSVPGHAPYDYVALANLKKHSSKVEQYGITVKEIESVVPISLISVKEYSEVPAADAVKKMGIKEQTDPKLEDATRELYRHEFHNGKLKANTGKYAGTSVVEAKEQVKQDLIKEGKATTMYELLNRPVFCRCKTECIVKLVQDQWFINYGDKEWKCLAHKNLDLMEILPEEVRQEFNNVIDWLHEKACARKSGMGTRLPWDKDWIIESLSDSTIYMAYYTIAKHIKQHKIQPKQLTDEALDYIFLGLGKPEDVSRKAGFDTEILREMHDEFMYFYPLDSRHSARELIPNHLTFMIFNHTAIFPENHWPRQIAANGQVMMEGSKMSKSFGNIIPLREGLIKFGADPLRVSILSTAELLQDSDFSPQIAKSMRDRLEKLYRFACETAKMSKKKPGKTLMTAVDRWMLSRLSKHIRTVTEAMNKLAVRKAVHTILYELDQDFQWYQKRIADQKETSERKAAVAEVFRTVLDAQVRMLAPIAPHLCEEIWEMLGSKDFIARARWPAFEESRIHSSAEENEQLIMDVLEDTQNIMKATGTKPKKIYYYTAAKWKWEVYSKALEKSSSKTSQKDLMKQLMQEPDLRANAEKVAKFAAQIADEINRTSEETKQRRMKSGVTDENEALEEARLFLHKELGAEIHVYHEEDSERHDPKNRAQFAKPYRPAIFVE
jgi:leucyl-tRNA synthetase